MIVTGKYWNSLFFLFFYYLVYAFSGFKEIAGYRFVIIDVVNRGGNSTYNEVLDSKLRVTTHVPSSALRLGSTTAQRSRS